MALKLSSVVPPVALIGAVGLAYAMSRSLTSATWALPVLLLVAMAAGPIWMHLRQQALFKRQALLSGSTTEASAFRRLLWNGSFTVALLVVSALAWAAVLLALGWLLTPRHWIAVGSVTVGMAFAIAPLNRWLSRHVLPHQVGRVGRLWPLRWLNLAALTVGFMAIDFYVGAPDTRSLAWNEVAERAFDTYRGALPFAPAAWLVGGLAAIDALAWHAGQSLIPALGDKDLRILGWMAVLLQASMFSIALTRFEMGVLALVEWVQGSTEHRRATVPAAAFVLVVFIVTAAGYTASTSYRPVAALPAPCTPDAKSALLLQVGLNARVQAARDAAAIEADKRIDAELDRLYGEVEQGVDGYLDWYFSIVGEYKRLWVILVSRGADEYLGEQVQKHLFDGVKFREQVTQITSDVSASTQGALASVASGVRERVRAQVQAQSCALQKVRPLILADVDGQAERAGAASLGGAIAPVIGRKAATGALAAIAASQAFRRGSGLLGLVTRRTVAGAPMFGCVFTGAFKPLCASVVAVLVWLGVDKAALEFSEATFRPRMKEDLMDAVRGHRADLATALKHRHLLEVEAMARSIRRSVDGAFIPARDGI